MLNKNVGVALASGLGIAFLGYCVYFDRKRRSHPDFKKRLIEKRRQQQQEKSSQDSSQFPDLNDETAVQTFFMKEISLGEQLMGLGDIENGVEHLANAVAVTAHKENLLNVLRTTLPDPIFRLLVERLPEVSRKQSVSPSRATVIEEAEIRAEQKIIEISRENLAIDDLLD